MADNLCPRINIYDCVNGHQLVTVDRDPGLTPMFHTCPTCHGRNESQMYSNIPKDAIPTHEWYKPSVQELRYKYAGLLLAAMVRHVENGGLNIRVIRHG